MRFSRVGGETDPERSTSKQGEQGYLFQTHFPYASGCFTADDKSFLHFYKRLLYPALSFLFAGAGTYQFGR